MRPPSSTLPALAVVLLGLTHCHKSSVVSWPELASLDATAEKAEGLCETHNTKGIRALLPELIPAGAALAGSAIPANAAQPAATAEILNDLKDLLSKLGDGAKLQDSDLEPLVASIHPIVEQLLITSGMPHIHEAQPK